MTFNKKLNRSEKFTSAACFAHKVGTEVAKLERLKSKKMNLSKFLMINIRKSLADLLSLHLSEQRYQKYSR